MKVAIIGAGLAGLSCAHELERYGISPVVYEDTDFIGDKEPHISAILTIADRPIKDAITYFKEELNLELTPLNPVKKLTHISPGQTTVIEGDNFGYFFKRGKDWDSVKGQLYAQLKSTKIFFGRMADAHELRSLYDYVVVANGNPDVAKQLGCWQDLISGWIRGAIVEGDFDSGELTMWLNREFCRNGYAYLCPESERRAALLIFVPSISYVELGYYWERFLDVAKIPYRILEEFAIQHFAGTASLHKSGNLYLAGNAGGAICPFLGFGQLNSITMGVSAARSIVEGLNYETLVEDVLDKEKAFYAIRRSFDKLTNSDYDKLFALIGLPGVRHLVYHTNLNVVKSTGFLLGLKDKILGKDF